MKLAVISDIHSNLEALEAVLGDIDEIKVDDIISLGDNIGYGADPEKVINTIRQRKIKTILGNHELALFDEKYLASFNPKAKDALIKNKRMLSAKSIKFIEQLDICRIHHKCRFVHGLPPDSATDYLALTSLEILETIMKFASEKICFTGHTHLLGMIQLAKGGISRQRITGKTVLLDKENRYILNAGSVGQPRDKDSRAKYLIWNVDYGRIEPRYVTYNNRLAAAKIKKAGIPEIYAVKLL